MERILIGTMCFYYFYIVFLVFFMFIQRKKAVENKQVDPRFFKSYLGTSPEYLQIIQNHFSNQFQIPVMFFLACILTLQQHKVSQVTIILAIGFVLSRIVHSYIHLGKNKLMKRVYSYATGVLIVGVMFLMNLC